MRYMFMKKRMTWDEIKKKYPAQWLGLTDVEWADPEEAEIASAVVSYTDKTADELLILMHDTNYKVIARSTPRPSMYVGMIG